MAVTVKLKENPFLCYQCAKCSAGCPVSNEMDLLPHQVIHLLTLGMEDRVVASDAIWVCAGCYTCATRCPNDIDITAVMDDLRNTAVERGIPCPRPEVLAFHQTFLRDVSRRGRVHELRMMGEYNLRKGTPFHDVALAMRMFFTGRLHLLPPKGIRGFKRWMNRLWKN